MFNIKETASTLKSTATKVNKEVLKTSEVVVEETIAAGEEWNKVFAKALKTGTHILSLQQELALMALEGAKKQYATGNVRLRKLLGFQTPQIVETVKTKVETVETKAKKVLASTAKRVEKKVEIKAKKVLATPAKVTVNPVAKKATKIDLKVINGIGPKMEKVLNVAGFNTYEDIAAATEAGMKTVLLAENPRYAMYEPKEWIAEAKKLVK
jgi:predicted flap endonuclease-1-like 5' DNA nuclease